MIKDREGCGARVDASAISLVPKLPSNIQFRGAKGERIKHPSGEQRFGISKNTRDRWYLVCSSFEIIEARKSLVS